MLCILLLFHQPPLCGPFHSNYLLPPGYQCSSTHYINKNLPFLSLRMLLLLIVECHCWTDRVAICQSPYGWYLTMHPDLLQTVESSLQFLSMCSPLHPKHWQLNFLICFLPPVGCAMLTTRLYLAAATIPCSCILQAISILAVFIEPFTSIVSVLLEGSRNLLHYPFSYEPYQSWQPPDSGVHSHWHSCLSHPYQLHI